MAASILSAPYFHNETAATAYVESRVWPRGAACPRCGSMERVGKLQGKSTRIGVWKCYECRKPFSVKVGTIFEDSHVGLHLWLQAIALVAASKKGISANQLHRTLGVTLKTAWFMGHRIREAMRSTSRMLGDEGTSGIVEADETYFGRTEGHGKGMRLLGKRKVFALMERGGAVRSFHVAHVTAGSLRAIMRENIAKAARVMTDSASVYRNLPDDGYEPPRDFRRAPVCESRHHGLSLVESMIVPFELDRRHVADRFEQPPVVEPVDPLQRRELDGLEVCATVRARG